MADPRIEHVPAWVSAGIPEGWRIRCCSAIGDHIESDGWRWGMSEALAVTGLAEHLDTEHGLTVTALQVVDMTTPVGMSDDEAHETGTFAARATRLVRLADLPAEAEA